MLKSQKELNKSLNRQIKLPQIKNKTSETLIMERPSSSNKVDELQRKLLNKLEDYEENSKNKGLTSKYKKKTTEQLKSKVINTDKDHKIYEKIQKFMPQLYEKLKDIHEVENSINYINHKQPQIFTSIQIQKQQRPFLAEKFIDQENNQQIKMSQLEIDQIFEQYIVDEGIIQQTSSSDLKEMQKQLLGFEKQIEKIQQSMCQLVKQIGLEFTNKHLDQQN